MILNPTDVQKHIAFRAPYTPEKSFNPAHEQFLKFNGRLFGLEVIDQPDTVPPSVVVKTGAFVARDRVIVQLLREQTLAKPVLAAPFALVAITDNEVATTNTELNFVEDQVLGADVAVLAEFDELGLLKQDPGLALGELEKDVHGGLVDRVLITTDVAQTVFDTRSLCFSALMGSDLLVFRDGRKLVFNLFGTNPAAGWIQSVGGVTFVGAGTVDAGEKWEFVLDRSIQVQENFGGNGTKIDFVLTQGTYQPGLGQTLVFLDGLYQTLGVDYTENDDGVTVSFVTAPAIGARVEVVVTTATAVFERFLGPVTGEVNLDLTRRLLRGGHAVLVFKNGLKLLRLDDYTDQGCERIKLVAPAVYGDVFNVYELRTTLRSVLNREFRELIDVSKDVSEAVRDPDSVRFKVASAANPFRTAEEVTEEIQAALGVTPPITVFHPAGSADFANLENVDFDSRTDEVDNEIYAEITGRDNLQTGDINFRFPVLPATTVAKLTIPFKLSDAGGSNRIIVKVINSDGTVLFTSAAADQKPAARTELVVTAAQLSAQPTNRFRVVAECSVDDGDVASVGSILAEYTLEE